MKGDQIGVEDYMTDISTQKDKDYFLNTLSAILEPNFNGWKQEDESSQPAITHIDDEIKDIAETMFNEIDVTRNGTLHKDEVRDYTRKTTEKCGGEFNEESFNAHFKNIDVNDDGNVSKTELLDFMMRTMKQ